MKAKTYMHPKEKVKRDWHLEDASNKILGKLAVKIATKLIGKHKPTYTPHVDAGDYVVVTNASQVKLTRNKGEKKMYRWHTGYTGALKEKTFNEMIIRSPEKVIRLAVKNMLPKNKHRKSRLARLKVYAGAEHKHKSQLAAK